MVAITTYHAESPGDELVYVASLEVENFTLSWYFLMPLMPKRKKESARNYGKACRCFDWGLMMVTCLCPTSFAMFNSSTWKRQAARNGFVWFTGKFK